MARTIWLTREERDLALSDGERCKALVCGTADIAKRLLGMVKTAPTPNHQARALDLLTLCVERMDRVAAAGVDIQASAVRCSTSNLMGRKKNRNALRSDLKSEALSIAHERQVSFTSTHGHPPTGRWLAAQIHKELCRKHAGEDLKVYSEDHIRKRILPMLRD